MTGHRDLVRVSGQPGVWRVVFDAGDPHGLALMPHDQVAQRGYQGGWLLAAVTAIRPVCTWRLLTRVHEHRQQRLRAPGR